MDRYILVVKSKHFLDIDRIEFKTLREAKMYYDIMTQEEKECAYIYDVVKHERVTIKGE